MAPEVIVGAELIMEAASFRELKTPDTDMLNAI